MKCKYWSQVEYCYRGNKCEYLHEEETIENNIEHNDKEVQSKVKTTEADTQTEDNPEEEEGIKIHYSNETEIIFKKCRCEEPHFGLSRIGWVYLWKGKGCLHSSQNWT